MSESNGVAVKKQPQLRPPRPTSFKLLVVINDDTYLVSPVAAHPEIARFALRFTKLTGKERAVYHVNLRPDGTLCCECKGWIHRGQAANKGKGCKHVATTAALLRLFNLGGAA
jgi:hypothetical protein